MLDLVPGQKGFEVHTSPEPGQSRWNFTFHKHEGEGGDKRFFSQGNFPQTLDADIGVFVLRPVWITCSWGDRGSNQTGFVSSDVLVFFRRTFTACLFGREILCRLVAKSFNFIGKTTKSSRDSGQYFYGVNLESSLIQGDAERLASSPLSHRHPVLPPGPALLRPSGRSGMK